MLETVSKLLNRAGDVLNRKLENQYAIYWVMAVVTTVFAIAGALIGISSYSPDSWAYFELAKTVFGTDFYKFNTFRSYFSKEYSAAFPLGYPVAIALVSLITGPMPMVAVAINVATVAASGLLLYHVGKRIGIPALPACALVLSLLLYPPYFDEVFTGRSIPFAILLFFAACYFYLRQQHFFSGILLGVSALVRFDFLVVGLLFQVMALFLGKKTRIQLLQLQIGFILGILPWVIYSYTHFNKLWISDNSWVALSAVPVFVLDYPAEATVSVNQAPVKWFFKVVSNTLPLSESILSSALLNPLLILTLAFAGWSALKFKYRANFKVIVLMALIFASTAPYLLTGYINPRYFSLFFVSIAAVLVYTNSRLLADADFIGLNFLGLTLLSVLITIPIGGVFLLADTLTGARKIDETHNQLKLIQTLKACHETERHKTYVFMKEGGFVAPRYGAVTGMRTAYIPSNFESMNESQKLAFLDVMKPYVLFDSLLKVEQCAKR